MNREDIINDIYNRRDNKFNFDKMQHPPLCCYLYNNDIIEINRIALSARLSARPDKKYKIIDDILKPRGFTRLHAGTNRLVYKHEFDPSIVLKVGIDRVGISDNPAELANQQFLKPFCCKVFDVSRCGTVALVERVNAVKNRMQFKEIAGDVFDIVMHKFAGIVLEDIGSNFFMNWGVRDGFGPVVLDYPYAYMLDGDKLVCRRKNVYANNTECGGLIDYDIGLNSLVCTKCGKRYTAKDLGKMNNLETPKQLIEKEEMLNMFTVRTVIKGKENKVSDSDGIKQDSYIKVKITHPDKPKKVPPEGTPKPKLDIEELKKTVHETKLPIESIESVESTVDGSVKIVPEPKNQETVNDEIPKTEAEYKSPADVVEKVSNMFDMINKLNIRNPRTYNKTTTTLDGEVIVDEYMKEEESTMNKLNDDLKNILITYFNEEVADEYFIDHSTRVENELYLDEFNNIIEFAAVRFAEKHNINRVDVESFLRQYVFDNYEMYEITNATKENIHIILDPNAFYKKDEVDNHYDKLAAQYGYTDDESFSRDVKIKSNKRLNDF